MFGDDSIFGVQICWHAELVYSVTFPPDGNRIVSGSGEHSIKNLKYLAQDIYWFSFQKSSIRKYLKCKAALYMQL